MRQITDLYKIKRAQLIERAVHLTRFSHRSKIDRRVWNKPHIFIFLAFTRRHCREFRSEKHVPNLACIDQI